MGNIDNFPNVKVYAGPMASGKTRELHSLMGRFEATHRPYAAYKPSLDIRQKGIQPRGVSESDAFGCEIVDSLADIDAASLVSNGISTVMLEEFHMFGYSLSREVLSNIFIESIRHWGENGITEVHAAGLDLAASLNPFPIFMDAWRFGADITLMPAYCEYPVLNGGPTCQAIAHNSQIYSDWLGLAYRPESLEDLLPQGDNPDRKYRAVCMAHLILPSELTIDFIKEFN
ncbi:MAG TPA: hypothetical protein VMR76_02010 [Candidatus Saccharimonadia bacterium]|nr:hypothetical protein [Candidatus Saccharimonadia bacterium]